MPTRKEVEEAFLKEREELKEIAATYVPLTASERTTNLERLYDDALLVLRRAQLKGLHEEIMSAQAIVIRYRTELEASMRIDKLMIGDSERVGPEDTVVLTLKAWKPKPEDAP